MNTEILKFSLGKGVLLDKETLSLLSEFDDATAKTLIEKISNLKEKIITKSFFTKNAEKIQELISDEKVIEKLKINLGLSLEISRERLVPMIVKEKKEEEKEKKLEEFKYGNVKVISSIINLTRKLKPADFTKYFRTRYNEIKGFLQERKELENLTSINKINDKKQSISVIGMVLNKRITKSKNILLEVEDLTGQVNVLINKDKVHDKAKEILEDDIIGIRGFGNREIIFASEIVYPDILLQEKTSLEKDERAAFISDLHVGSKNFLEKNFLKFIEWVNGKIGDEKQKEEAKKIKYLFVNGDTIDGVGIFPGQEKLLAIKDIREQYKKLAELLARIRKDVKIILCPGQHDSVRVAEPQHPIGKEFGLSLYELENLILVSNPCMIEITNNGKKGIRILMYHGASMNSYINEIDSLRLGKAHDFPSRVVKEMLKRRHLSSMHSSVTYIPYEAYDPLVIKEIPDIITTADLHKPDVDIYN